MINDKWYQKTWVILICLIAFLPLGLFLLWKNKELRRELGPTLKWTAIAMGCIFIYGIFFRDNIKPTLETKPEISIKANEQNTEQDLINKAVIKLDDDQTSLNNNDVKIMNYDKLDLHKKGKQTIKLLVHDKAANTTASETIINIK